MQKVLRDKREEGTNLTSIDSIDTTSKEKPVEKSNQPPRVVTREITRQIQGELNRIGCSAGTADGLWGKKSVNAVSSYSRHAKVRLATLQPTYELLEQLQGYTSRICPTAKPRKPAVKHQVVKQQGKKCQAGQKLSRKGNCYWPKVKQATTCQPGQKISRNGNCFWPKARQTQTCQPGQQLSRNGNCFWPNQQPHTGVIVQQRQPQHGVIVQQRQPRQQGVIIQQQPQQRRSGLLGGAIKGIVGGVILNCALGNC